MIIVIKEWDYADDGFSIYGLFDDRESAEKHIKENYPDFIMDDYGDFYRILDGNFSSKEWMNLYHVDKVI